MSLPARKQPGASRRRKKQAHLRRVKRRLIGGTIVPGKLVPWDSGTPVGQSVLADVKRMIDELER